jgi:galactokinase
VAGVISALDRLRPIFAGTPSRGFRAPGRANLIGEHTDYNGGFVLPVALELNTYVVGRRTTDEMLRLRSLDRPGEVRIDLRSGAGPEGDWGLYATSVVRAALDEGWSMSGFDGIVASDVPIGAGLSSSASLEVSVALAVLDGDCGPLVLARMCRRAENVYVGMGCGIMDQLAATASEPGCALLIDCMSETYEPVPLPPGLSVLVIDSTVRRNLIKSGYNQRREECERAARAIGVDFLRHADARALDRVELDDAALSRARHVISENKRVEKTAVALHASDLSALGDLFSESHESMAGDFDISTPEIDVLIEIARATPGVIATRLTGGGFGGCTVSLVEDESEVVAAEAIVADYEQRTGLRARYWVSRPSAAAGPLEITVL